MKAIIIHGWGGYPGEGWQKWLKEELEDRGWEVEAPKMPQTMVPKIDKWVGKLRDVIKSFGDDKDVFLIGHSIGAQAILRYLENGKKVKGCIFVAGWFNLSENAWDEDFTHEIADPWLNEEIDFEKVKKKAGKVVAVFSTNDIYVPLEDKEIFKEKLNADIVIEEGKGHFSGEENINELPVVLGRLLEMADG